MEMWREIRNERVSVLNNLIRAAIDHGGDYGGPYFCNPEELEKAMDALCKMTLLTWKWTHTDRKDYPEFE